jgi:hypothetical protein
MTDTIEHDGLPAPPDAHRVAARALVLAAVSSRGQIESDELHPAAEAFRQRAVDWLHQIGVSPELEPEELSLLSTPLGQLHRQLARNAGWRAEGLVVLAWALGRAVLPPASVECDFVSIANSLSRVDVCTDGAYT